MAKDFAFRRKPGHHQGVTYVSLFWGMALILLCSALMQERIPFLSNGASPFMNDAEFYVCFGVFAFLVIGFLLHVNRNFRIPVNWPWAIVFGVLCVGNGVGTFMLESHLTGSGMTYRDVPLTYDITFTMDERVRWVVGFFAACVLFYLMFAVFPKIFHNFRRLHLIWYITILVAVAAIVYSLIKEWNLYVSSFQPENPWNIAEATSFTNNPNNFAYVLMLGIVAVCFLHSRRSHWYWWVLIFFFATCITFIGSGASALATAVLVAAFATYRFFATLKYHTGKALIFYFLFWAGIITLIVCIGMEAGPANMPIARIGQYMKKQFFSTEVGRLRLRTWSTIFYDMLNTPIRLIFGVGDTQGLFYLGAIEFDPAVSVISYSHNGFFQNLLNGGLLRLAIYLGILCRFFYLCVASLKRKSHLGWAAIITAFAILLRGMFETTSLLSAEGNGLSFFVLAVLPIEVEAFLAKHPEVEGYEVQAIPDAEKTKFVHEYPPLRCAKIAFLFVTPVVALGLGPVPHILFAFGQTVPASYYAVLVASFLLIPFAFYCLCHHADHSDRAIYGTLLGIVLIASSLAGAIVSFFVPLVGWIAVGVIAFFTLLTYLFHCVSVARFREKLFLHAYLPHLLICGVLVGVSSALYFIPAEMNTPMVPIVATLMIFVMYTNCFHTRWGYEMTYPLCLRLQAWDCRRSAIGTRKEVRMAAKQNHYLVAGHDKVPEPKTFYVRF